MSEDVAHMKVTVLDEAAFKVTFVEPVKRVKDGEPVVDFWPYFDAIPAADFESHDCSAGEVEYVYRMADCFEHVMVRSTTQKVFMAIVIDLVHRRVTGHRLMNFNTLYGRETPDED